MHQPEVRNARVQRSAEDADVLVTLGGAVLNGGKQRSCSLDALWDAQHSTHGSVLGLHGNPRLPAGRAQCPTSLTFSASSVWMRRCACATSCARR